MRLLAVVLMACCVGLYADSAPADGGRITGVVKDAALGQGIEGAAVRAFACGRSVGVGCLTDADGSYVLADLPAGQYTVCVPAGESYRPPIAPVEVREGAATRVNPTVCQSIVIDGDSWLQAHQSFGQSFVPTGLGLTMVGIKAFGPQRDVAVQLLRGDDPNGEPVGPGRTIAGIGGEGSGVMWWSGGEVPMVPHSQYTVGMSAAGGQKWVPGVAGGGDVYALGMAYFEGSPRPDSDLGIVICEDNDDVRTNYALAGSARTYWAISAGQTFVALSKNVTFASAVLSGQGEVPVYVRFSIHEGGPGGMQIGPSKGVAAGEDAAVAWCPNEVPITPGGTYYLHVESFGGDEFLTAVHPDTYAQGQAVFNGRPVPDRDLCAMVAGQITDEDFARLVAHPRSEKVVPLAGASFEDGLAGWKRQGEFGAVVGCDAGVVPAWGTKMFGWTNRDKGEGSRTTIYQCVEVESGAGYSFSGSVYTDHQGGRSSDVKVRLVVLPAGGQAVRDNDKMESSQWYATEGQWRRGSVEFRAAAETITVGFELEQRFSLESSSLYVDGAHLERIGAR